jgi:hypothetical protein
MDLKHADVDDEVRMRKLLKDCDVKVRPGLIDSFDQTSGVDDESFREAPSSSQLSKKTNNNKIEPLAQL